MADRRVEIYTDKQGRRRRRVLPIDKTDRTPRRKIKGQPRERRYLEIDPRTRMELEKKRKRRVQGLKPIKPRGNPAVVETFEDARENAMINRDVPTMKHGGEAVVRGMGCAIKGGKFEGVF
jgi:hypothetical protein|tara:strand:- start:891 stop:1253 length:363 start_codon:yes stop_codon:yes gene_type:complete